MTKQIINAKIQQHARLTTSDGTFSMIEMMEDYTNKLEDCLKKMDNTDVKLVPDDIAVNLKPACSPSHGVLADFTNCRMAVMMMMSVNSAVVELGNDCNLVDVVREALISLVGEVIVVEEAWNSIIVAVGTNTSQPTGTPVPQLLQLASQVINKVRNRELYIHRNVLFRLLALSYTLRDTVAGQRWSRFERFEHHFGGGLA